MPLLYGEGDKAYLRLQTEIIRTSGDETIFAWTDPDGRPEDGYPVLAAHPEAFARSGNVHRIFPYNQNLYSLTNRGLSFTSRICTLHFSDPNFRSLVVIQLACKEGVLATRRSSASGLLDKPHAALSSPLCMLACRRAYAGGPYIRVYARDLGLKVPTNELLVTSFRASSEQATLVLDAGIDEFPDVGVYALGSVVQLTPSPAGNLWDDMFNSSESVFENGRKLIVKGGPGSDF